MAFLLRARRILDEREPVRPDFAMLTASLSAARPTASPSPSSSVWRADPRRPALAEILSGGPGWREAVEAQRGSFCPAMTRDQVERP